MTTKEDSSPQEIPVPPANHPGVESWMTADACPYLASQPGDPKWRSVAPANGGRVPRALLPVLFLDMLAVGLVIPLLSLYAKGVGGSKLFVGALGTAYGVAQLIGSSVLGGLSDSIGRVPVLQLSLIGAAAGYATLWYAVAVARSPAWLVMSRIPIGLFKQSQTISRAVVSDCTRADSRMAALGGLSATIGAGFVFGPMFGGILSKRAKFAPPLIAAVLFLLGFVITTFGVPETAPRLLHAGEEEEESGKKQGDGQEETEEETSPPPRCAALLSFWALVRDYPFARKVIATKLLVDLPYMMMQTSFALYTQEVFALDAKKTGYVLALAGVVNVLAHSAIVPRLARGCCGTTAGAGREYPVMVFGALLSALSLVALGAAPSATLFVAAIAPLSLGSALYKTAVTAILTQSVPPHDAGRLSGAVDAMNSVCRVVAPAIGGLLMEYAFDAAPFVLGGACSAVGALALALVVPRRGAAGGEGSSEASKLKPE